MAPLKRGAGRAAGARSLRSAHQEVVLAADQSQTVDAATSGGILGVAAHASRAVQGVLPPPPSFLTPTLAGKVPEFPNPQAIASERMGAELCTLSAAAGLNKAPHIEAHVW